MAQVLIIYASDYGNTEKMAHAAAEGVNSVDGINAVVKKAEEVTADDMTASDGVIFGSPVHMGAVDWRVKKFIDTVCSGLWMQDKMNGKVAGVFTSTPSSSPSDIVAASPEAGWMMIHKSPAHPVVPVIAVEFSQRGHQPEQMLLVFLAQ